jgi:hypothetical protein
VTHATSRQELVHWVAAHGRLPSISKVPGRAEETLLAHRLYKLKKTHRDGNAKLHHLELLLSIPGCLDDRGRADAETRAAELRRQHEAKLLEQQSKVPFDEARWKTSFAELKGWVSAAGGLPRRRTEDPLEYKVANWLNIQRTHARNSTLSPGREAKLRTVPGALAPQPNRPARERMAAVQSFVANHGRMPSPVAQDRAEASLGRFVAAARSRIRGGYFSAELTSALTVEAVKIPGFLPPDGGRFNRTAAESLQALRDYVARHGHLPSGNDDKSLFGWYQKTASGRVGGTESAAFQAAILEIRASYPIYASWLTVTRFEEYVAAHGHLPPESKTQRPQLSKATLRRLLKAPSAPEPFKDRIRSILASTSYQDGTSACRLGDACKPGRGAPPKAARKRTTTTSARKEKR